LSDDETIDAVVTVSSIVEATRFPADSTSALMIADRRRFVQYRRMKPFAFLFLLLVPILVFAEGGLPDRPYIYVEGKAEIEKTADIMIVRFDIVGRAPQQPKANEEVQTKANKIFGLLKDRKIGDNDVIAEDIRSQPEFQKGDEYSDNRGKIIGYKVSRTFQIKLRDVAAFPKLVDDLINVGAEFYGIEGGLAKQKEIESETWEKALANAREQANKTLRPLNMKIDSVFAVSPVSFPSIQTDFFGEGAISFRSAEMQAAEVERVSVTPQYRLAPVKVTQRVHVIYLISSTP
jgi:uncharacterized protein YggE